MVIVLIGLQIWLWEPVRLAEKVILVIFLSFSLKAHNYHPAYHIGPDFANWKVSALWNSFHENVVNAIIFCAKEARALIVLDIEWVQFVLKNCEKLQNYRFKWKRQKRKNSVRGLYDKKEGLIVLFTWDVMRKSIFKRLVYTPPDSSPRFTCKVNVSNTKIRADFLFWPPF